MMTRKALVFEAEREGYGIDQIRRPMTVGELKELLENFDDNMLFVLSHDNGYTYGSLDATTAMLFEEQDGGEWAEAD